MILAIDDDAGRYEHFGRLLGGRAEVVVACCPACVAELLPKAAAVLLDYDLDSGDVCNRCSASYDTWREYAKAIHYVPAVAARGVPVVVTSSSSSENIRALCAKLRAYDVRFRQHRATDPDPEVRWIGELWVMGVL